MTIALSGAEGAVAQGTTNTALSVFYGSGATPSNNKLGVLVVCGTGTNSFPALPTGWSLVAQDQSTNTSVSVYERETANGDSTSVSIGAVASTTYIGKLWLFTGAVTSSPIDQTKTNNGTTSPLSATATGADATRGELEMAFGYCRRTGASTATTSITLNNGASQTDTHNDASSAAAHYRFTWGITTGNSGADATTFTTDQTAIQGIALVLASFKRVVTTVTGAAQLDTTSGISTSGFRIVPGSVSLDTTSDLEVTDFEFPPVISDVGAVPWILYPTTETTFGTDSSARMNATMGTAQVQVTVSTAVLYITDSGASITEVPTTEGILA